MAAVILHRSRVRCDDLPNLCLRCGAPATVHRAKTFSKSQGWTSALAILGGLPWLLASWVFRDYFRVTVPLCDRHRHHFTWQAGILWGGLALLGAMLAGSFALIGQGTDEQVRQAFTATAVVGGVWVVVFLGSRLTGITAGTIDDRQALILGVSDRFAKAYERGEEREPVYAYAHEG